MANVTQKKPIRRPGESVVAVGLAAPLHGKLKKVAKAERRSLSKQLGLVVESYFEGLSSKDGKGAA